MFGRDQNRPARTRDSRGTRDDVSTLHRLNDKIHEMRGLYLEFDGKDLIVSGRLLRWEDWFNLSEVATENVGPMRDLPFAPT